MLRLPLIFGHLTLFYSIIHSLCVPSNELKQAVPSCVDHKHLKKKIKGTLEQAFQFDFDSSPQMIDDFGFCQIYNYIYIFDIYNIILFSINCTVYVSLDFRLFIDQYLIFDLSTHLIF